MMSSFDAEHRLFRESLRAFLAREVTPFVDEWERERMLPYRELFRKLGDQGYLGLAVDERYGGLGLDFWFQVVFLEELGRLSAGGVAMAVSLQTDIATAALTHHGSEELKQHYLKPAVAGDSIGALAVTEPDAGSDLAALTTTVRFDGDTAHVSGHKAYVTNGSVADFVVVLARHQDASEERNMSLVVIPVQSPGITASPRYRDTKVGNHCCDHAEISFRDVIVPSSNVIGAPGRGWEIQMNLFARERAVEAVLLSSQVAALLESTIAYTKSRHTFGRRLIDHPAIAFRLVDMQTELELLRSLTYRCVDLMIREKPCFKESAMVKLKAGRLIREVADSCLHLLGAHGYMEEVTMARLSRDTRASALAGGSIEVMQRILAKLL